MNLERFFLNPFNRRGISMAELLAFTTDNLQRLMAAKLAALAERIAATSAALNDVDAAYSDNLTKLGVRKGRKLMKQTFRRALPASITKIHAAVVAQFGSKSPEMKECFANGRRVFKTVTDDLLGEKLQTLIVGLEAHEAVLPKATADARAILAAWLPIYEGSETSSATVSAAVLSKKAARAALQRELFLNLLALVQLFPDEPAVLRNYMQPSLLEDRPRRKKAAAITA